MSTHLAKFLLLLVINIFTGSKQGPSGKSEAMFIPSCLNLKGEGAFCSTMLQISTRTHL